MDLTYKRTPFERKPEQASAAPRGVSVRSKLEKPDVCAYNETRECFLALEVLNVDTQTTYRGPVNKLATSAWGIWMNPFRGALEPCIRDAMDLVYLDSACSVIDIVESFAPPREIPWNQRTASVLALPCHTIYSSQTQLGDQLIIDTTEGMVKLLEQLSNPVSDVNPVEGHVLVREVPLWGGGPGVLELQRRSNQQLSQFRRQYEVELIDAGKRAFKPSNNWLQKWWFPDPRRSPRGPATGLAAYFWTGAPPSPHNIRDINSHGLYLVTEERWYPGTLVLMTLQKTNCEDRDIERSIQVYTRAVRWGADGVGFQFVLADSGADDIGTTAAVDSANRKALKRFLSGSIRSAR